MMRALGILRIFAAFALCAVICACAVSCAEDEVGNGGDTTADGTKTELDYSKINIDDYVGPMSYKGLTLTLETPEASKEDAVWAALLGSADIAGYPEDAVAYYFKQTKDYYMFVADNDPEAYEMLLESRGITESDIEAEARELVKKDLVYLYVTEKEGITVSETEKEQLFDRYVAAFVAEYGYTREYVTQHLTGHIYEAMLYDKTLEFLILNNSFEVKSSGGGN